MRFIDLFAGLGGFHVALRALGHECVFASEIDPDLRTLYQKNFGIAPHGDIRVVLPEDVPSHEILCAGFPCQPFSKAGDQQGLHCNRWGNLIENVLAISQYHRPRFVLLENVANLERHDQGRTWQLLRSRLTSIGYKVDAKTLSPHQFGIPQIRERFFIAAWTDARKELTWPQVPQNANPQISSILDIAPSSPRLISPSVVNCLDAWQDFLNQFPSEVTLPSFPIWSMEFGATYPYRNTTPFATPVRVLSNTLGCYGKKLYGRTKSELLSQLPSYARTNDKTFPKWKEDFICKNREFYLVNKKILDRWIPSILDFPQSYQKFEWNCQGEARNIWNYVIQMRASGVRVKRPTTSPSLVAMTTSQVPIIGWERRYMSPTECARLQGMDHLELPRTLTGAYKALGNAVNVDIVHRILSHLLEAGNIAETATSKRKISLTIQDRRRQSRV